MRKIIIFGSSEKTFELGRRKLSQLLNSYTTIGLNDFGLRNPVDYILLSDTSMGDKIIESGLYKGQKILTNRHCYKHKFKNKPQFNVAETFEPNGIEGSIANSAFYAIWWAVKEGYTHIDLYGVLDADNYIQVANGNVYGYNSITGNKTCFDDNQYYVLKTLIENNWNGKVKICRPLKK